LPSACSFIVEVSCHCFTLHVSAYMTIFRCIGCYYCHVLEGTYFAGFFFLYLTRGYVFVGFYMCFPVLFSRFILLFLACVFICLYFRVVFLFHCLYLCCPLSCEYFTKGLGHSLPMSSLPLSRTITEAILGKEEVNVILPTPLCTYCRQLTLHMCPRILTELYRFGVLKF
jgi:hypothetical protein